MSGRIVVPSSPGSSSPGQVTTLKVKYYNPLECQVLLIQQLIVTFQKTWIFNMLLVWGIFCLIELVL